MNKKIRLDMASDIRSEFEHNKLNEIFIVCVQKKLIY